METEEEFVFQDYSADDWLLLFNTSDYELLETSGDGSYNEALEQVVRVFQQCLPPMQVLLSCITNLLVLVVMSRMKDKVHQLCAYLLVVAGMDILIILQDSGNAWLMRILGRDYLKEYMNHSEICCKVVTYFKHLFQHLSVWMTVTVCIENLFVNLNPAAVRHFHTQRVTDVICLILVLVMCFNLHYFWTYGVILLEFDIAIGHVIKEKYCFFFTKTLKGTSHQTDGYIWKTLDHVLVEYLPMLAMLISSILIHLAKAGKISMNSPRPSWDKDFLDCKAFVELTSRTLLVLGWALPITFMPHMVFFHLSKLKSVDKNPLVESVLTEWKNLFFSGKVFIYMATNHKFRQETKLLLMPLVSRVCALCHQCHAACGNVYSSWCSNNRVVQEDEIHAEQIEAFV